MLTIPNRAIMQDGCTVYLGEMVGRIEEVKVPTGRRSYCDSGLPKDCEALLTSILVRPPGTDLRGFDLGQLVFRYNDKARFSAPVRSLMDRYHNLATGGAVLARTRLLFDPSAGVTDWLEDGLFAGALPGPIHMREHLYFEFQHVPAEGSNLEGLGLYELQVEMQMLINRPASFNWRSYV